MLSTTKKPVDTTTQGAVEPTKDVDGFRYLVFAKDEAVNFASVKLHMNLSQAFFETLEKAGNITDIFANLPEKSAFPMLKWDIAYRSATSSIKEFNTFLELCAEAKKIAGTTDCDMKALNALFTGKSYQFRNLKKYSAELARITTKPFGKQDRNLAMRRLTVEKLVANFCLALEKYSTMATDGLKITKTALYFSSASRIKNRDAINARLKQCLQEKNYDGAKKIILSVESVIPEGEQKTTDPSTLLTHKKDMLSILYDIKEYDHIIKFVTEIFAEFPKMTANRENIANIKKILAHYEEIMDETLLGDCYHYLFEMEFVLNLNSHQQFFCETLAHIMQETETVIASHQRFIGSAQATLYLYEDQFEKKAYHQKIFKNLLFVHNALNAYASDGERSGTVVDTDLQVSEFFSLRVERLKNTEYKIAGKLTATELDQLKKEGSQLDLYTFLRKSFAKETEKEAKRVPTPLSPISPTLETRAPLTTEAVSPLKTETLTTDITSALATTKVGLFSPIKDGPSSIVPSSHLPRPT